MSRRKISVIVLSTLLFGNSLNCLSANQKRTVQRGRVVGHLVTPNVTITTNNPGEIPIVSDTENNDTITDNVPNEEPEPVVDDNETAKKNARIKEIKAKYRQFLNDAQLNCMDISDKLKVIQGLATGTTVISTAGTLATGGALASEIVKQGNDKRQGLETGLLVGGALTSTGGVITSAVALADMDKLINKMKDCRDNINNIKMVRSELVEEDVEDTDDTLNAVNDIVSNCGGIDNNSVKNVESIKKILVGSTVTSSVGAATSVVAAVTNNIKAKDATEENKLNLATQISTGISTGAQGVTLILGATTLSKVNKDKDTADDCEKTLMKY
ncbi:hypothetical protein HDR59_05010 [bacterium]|nr:hypothetical protein [bacterium]